MEPLSNDRWQGTFQVTEVGRYCYTLRAWVDRFGTWRQALAKKAEAGQDVSLDLLAGAQLVAEASRRVATPTSNRGSACKGREEVRGDASQTLREWSGALALALAPTPARVELVSPKTTTRAGQYCFA